MRILLIAPPSKRIPLNISGVYAMPPLGLAYIAAVLKKEGFSPDILDMPALNLMPDDIPAYFKKGDYAVCGISCNIFNLQDGLKIARLIKEIDPHATTVLGGRCSGFSPELIFGCNSGIDIIARGEGEELMLNLCKSISSRTSCAGLPGISYIEKGRIVDNDVNGANVDLDSLPFPARELLPNRRYRIHPPFNIRSPITIMETSRGCPFHCVFCSLHGRFRERSAGSVLDELKQITSVFGIKEVYFADPNLTVNKKRMVDLCERILKNGIKISWSCKSRVDLVDWELLRMMRLAGCYMISYGIESGSQAVLDGLNKGINIEDTYAAFTLTRKEKIRTLAYVLIASPGENDNSIRETRLLVRRVKPDFVLFGELLPDPTSALMQKDIREGRTTAQEIFDFYVFNKDAFGKSNLYGINRKKIRHWLERSNLSFYGRPEYLFGRLKDIRNFRDFSNMVQGVYFLIRDKVRIGKKNNYWQ